MSDEEKRQKWRWAAGSAQAKKVKALEVEFNNRLKAVHKVEFEEKVKKKKRIDTKLMENLETCKKHGGPLTMHDLERVQSLDYNQLVAEVGYLKKTIAPQLRFKRRVENKFVNYTADQLRQQIIDVLKPINDTNNDIESLLKKAFEVDVDLEKDSGSNQNIIQPAMHGIWKGLLDERVISASIDYKQLQKYKKTRHDYVPQDIPQDLSEWRLVEAFTEDQYHYVAKGAGVYLIVNE